jgi:hypothetical protein
MRYQTSFQILYKESTVLYLPDDAKNGGVLMDKVSASGSLEPVAVLGLM